MPSFRGRNQLVLPIEILSNQGYKCIFRSSAETMYVWLLMGPGCQMQSFVEIVASRTNGFCPCGLL